MKTPRSKAGPSPRNPQRRRLADKILAAFHTACDETEAEIAKRILERLDSHISQPSTLPAGVERRRTQNLAGAYERLWNLPEP